MRSLRDSSSSSSTPFPSSCKAKRLLQHEIRPVPNIRSNKSILQRYDMCLSRCIYCDIWKLASLVYSRVPATPPPSPPASPCSLAAAASIDARPILPNLASPTSPSSSSSTSVSSIEHDYIQSIKMLESAYQQQRSRLNSIISICTVDGAESTPGLRAAHDRCLSAVLDLVRQERALEARMAQLRRRHYEASQPAAASCHLRNSSDRNYYSVPVSTPHRWTGGCSDDYAAAADSEADGSISRGSVRGVPCA